MRSVYLFDSLFVSSLPGSNKGLFRCLPFLVDSHEGPLLNILIALHRGNRSLRRGVRRSNRRRLLRGSSSCMHMAILRDHYGFMNSSLALLALQHPVLTLLLQLDLVLQKNLEHRNMEKVRRDRCKKGTGRNVE